MFKKQVCPIHLKHVSSSKMVLRECSTSEDKGQCWGHGGRPLVVFCSTDWDAHYSIAMEQMSALLFQIDTETSQISWKTETSLTSQWLNWFKLYQTHIFNCPEQLNRWTCHSLTDSLTHSLTHWLPYSKLDWCDPGVWRCQLKTCCGFYCCSCWW